MNNVAIIAAVGRSGQIGMNGVLPWYDGEDLRWFRHVTMGQVLIVGSKTLELLPPLPGRAVFGWGREIDPGQMVASLVEKNPDKMIFIAGGARTYQAFMPFVRTCHITRVNYDGPADTFMPHLWGPNPVNTDWKMDA
ncbi:dihydrofolate reductase [Methylobacterium ajmalii]|uniref:dihydrofolate reductase n=1 Tax=Methylobacterium ajmalii TaxID=2738439 RepID=A0ABV0A526_9HYPH